MLASKKAFTSRPFFVDRIRLADLLRLLVRHRCSISGLARSFCAPPVSEVYAALVAGSSIFLFALYTLSSGGFPWYFAYASTKLDLISAHWAVLPCLILLGGLIAMVLKARQRHRQLRFLSLTPIAATNTLE
jgi:hypothetical protein